MTPDIKHASPTDPDSTVGAADHDRAYAWMYELPSLLWRYADLGIIHDAGQMDLAELHGVYRYLSRLQRTSRTKVQSDQPNNA